MPVAFLAAMVGCDHQTGQLLGNAGQPSAGVVDVVQGSAAPGDRVQVEADQPVLALADGAQIRIGGQPALIAEHVDPTHAIALVPQLPPGPVDVVIVELGKTPGAPGRLNVLPADALELVLTFGNDRVGLIDSSPRAGLLRRSGDEGGHRLQFVVLNHLGRVVFRNVINHPTSGRHEVFDEPAPGARSMHVAGQRLTGLFGVKIPNVPGGATVLFFDVPAGVDLSTPQGMSARIFLNAIQVP